MPPPIRADQDEGLDRSARKRGAILSAATDVFLKGGYLGTNVDAIAAVSGVSKQTVYKHFGSKEALFVEIVARMTSDAGDLVVGETPEPDDSADLAGYLRAYADKQLAVVLTPRLMQLRRLVIGEVSRFPDLAKVLYERGPQRALTKLTAMFERLAARGLLTLDDPSMAASHFNWVIMADPLNRAMLLGDGAIPAADDLRRHVAEGVRVFLAAYATRPSRKQGAPKKTRVTERPPAITPATHGAVRALEAVSKPPRGGPSTGPRVASGYSRTRR